MKMVRTHEEANSKEELVIRAKTNFGVTEYCQEAGFILEDGTMLDFSGKNEGAPAGMRHRDHREIKNVFDRKHEPSLEEKSTTELMDLFMQRANAIRYSMSKTKHGTYDLIIDLDTYHSPTIDQQRQLERCCKDNPDRNIIYDIYGKDGHILRSEAFDSASCKLIDEMLELLEEEKGKESESSKKTNNK